MKAFPRGDYHEIHILDYNYKGSFRLLHLLHTHIHANDTHTIFDVITMHSLMSSGRSIIIGMNYKIILLYSYNHYIAIVFYDNLSIYQK